MNGIHENKLFGYLELIFRKKKISKEQIKKTCCLIICNQKLFKRHEI